jgi:hypothetical protein
LNDLPRSFFLPILLRRRISATGYKPDAASTLPDRTARTSPS